MTIDQAYVMHEEIGEYRGIIKAIRNRLKRVKPESLTADYAADLGVSAEEMEAVVRAIKEHPDWDDRTIACEISWDE